MAIRLQEEEIRLLQEESRLMYTEIVTEIPAHAEEVILAQEELVETPLAAEVRTVHDQEITEDQSIDLLRAADHL